MRFALWGLAVAALLLALHRVALWAERRGWIYYRKHGTSAAISGAVLEAQALLEPSHRHAREEQTRQHVQSDDSGEPPVPGANRS